MHQFNYVTKENSKRLNIRAPSRLLTRSVPKLGGLTQLIKVTTFDKLNRVQSSLLPAGGRCIVLDIELACEPLKFKAVFSEQNDPVWRLLDKALRRLKHPVVCSFRETGK